MSCWELDNPCGQDVFKIFKLQEKLQLDHTIKHEIHICWYAEFIRTLVHETAC